jgi:hypothetical protein
LCPSSDESETEYVDADSEVDHEESVSEKTERQLRSDAREERNMEPPTPVGLPNPPTPPQTRSNTGATWERDAAINQIRMCKSFAVDGDMQSMSGLARQLAVSDIDQLLLEFPEAEGT